MKNEELEDALADATVKNKGQKAALLAATVKNEELEDALADANAKNGRLLDQRADDFRGFLDWESETGRKLTNAAQAHS